MINILQKRSFENVVGRVDTTSSFQNQINFINKN